jgi:hypothetical protein
MVKRVTWRSQRSEARKEGRERDSERKRRGKGRQIDKLTNRQ